MDINKNVWLIRTFKLNETHLEVEKALKELGLTTVCTTALCPNKVECFNRGTATFQILGNICTRNCAFCAIQHGVPDVPDSNEPEKIAEFSARFGLKYTVITSVTRDDLEDGGAQHFVNTIKAVRLQNYDTAIEVLTPDFKGIKASVELIAESNPDVFSHNVETVERLYKDVKPGSNLYRSLDLLRQIKEYRRLIITKSSIMLGLGETEDELFELLEKLREAECDIVTIGQYLAPSPRHYHVKRYYSPEEFTQWKKHAESIGFMKVFAGVFQRSSYHAEMVFINNNLKDD